MSRAVDFRFRPLPRSLDTSLLVDSVTRLAIICLGLDFCAAISERMLAPAASVSLPTTFAVPCEINRLGNFQCRDPAGHENYPCRRVQLNPRVQPHPPGLLVRGKRIHARLITALTLYLLLKCKTTIHGLKLSKKAFSPNLLRKSMPIVWNDDVRTG